MYNFDSPSKGKNDVFYEVKKYILMLNEKYKKDQSRITWLSIRLPINVTSIDLNPMLRIAVTDLCAKKFSSESLVLLMETRTKLKIDYLNRVSKLINTDKYFIYKLYIYICTFICVYQVRMNTISRYQIFSPIPFIEFHPDIIYADEATPNEVDVNSNYGKYDEQNYNNIAFYIKDYNASMKFIYLCVNLL